MSGSRKNALGFIFVTILIDVMGFGIIIPVMPKLIAQLAHVPVNEAAQYGGWLMFAYAFMQFICAPIVGGLSDRYGRRPVLLGSILGLGIDFVFLALAPTLWWLFVGRMISGAFGASFTTATAYIADVSEPEKRAQNFGLVGIAFGLGFIIGPVLGGLAGAWGPRVPFWLASCLSGINALYGYFVLPESLAPENRRPFSWKRANPLGSLLQLSRYPMLIGLVACIVLMYLAAHAVQSTWGYFTMGQLYWTEAEIGYSLGFVGLLIAIVQGGLVRVIVPNLGQKRSVYLGLSFYTIGLFLLAFATQSWMMYAFIIPYCLGGLAGPTLQGIMSNQVPASEQGELQGITTSLISVTSIIGPPVMTGLYAHFSSAGTSVHFPGAAFMAGALFTGISALLATRALAGFVEKKAT